MYDSSTGRFISRDPIDSTNLYEYVENNPANEIDPSGLQSEAVCVLAQAAKGCKALDIDVTFNPGGTQFRWGNYTDPLRGMKVGNPIHVVFKVEGDPKLCTYFHNEKGFAQKAKLVKGKWDWDLEQNIKQDKEIKPPGNPPTYDDMLGIPVTSAGTFLVIINLDITFKVIGSDKIEKEKKVHLEGFVEYEVTKDKKVKTPFNRQGYKLANPNPRDTKTPTSEDKP